MPCVAVVGAQWGDEGKGKVVDLLAERADMVVRYGGGANAGHTLVIGGERLITHLVPSGVLHPGTRCVLGDGMVIEPKLLIEEMAALRRRGLLSGDELLISERAHIVMPYHKMVEDLREEKAHAIGTTRRGIGPAYESKVARRGVRVADLQRPERLRELVERNMGELGAIIAHYGERPPGRTEIDSMIDEALRAGEELAPLIGSAGVEVDRAVRRGANVLFEGAQGVLLDLDHGTYPFVTSSTTTAAGACQGGGIGPTRLDRVLGITKAYTTRVGSGPFPTEMMESEAVDWRRAGEEFGATTGRPRRCGWLDIPALRLAVRVSGINSLALTKLDVVGQREHLQVCVGYRVDGCEVEDLPFELEDADVEPIFREFEGWDEPAAGARSRGELPAAARTYMEAIEHMIGIPFSMISVGPEREQTIELGDVFAP